MISMRCLLVSMRCLLLTSHKKWHAWYVDSCIYNYYVCCNARCSARAYGGKYAGLGCIGDRVMAELDRDDSKRRHSFCQIGIAHGVGHSYS